MWLIFYTAKWNDTIHKLDLWVRLLFWNNWALSMSSNGHLFHHHCLTAKLSTLVDWGKRTVLWIPAEPKLRTWMQATYLATGFYLLARCVPRGLSAPYVRAQFDPWLWVATQTMAGELCSKMANCCLDTEKQYISQLVCVIAYLIIPLSVKSNRTIELSSYFHDQESNFSRSVKREW